MKSTFSQPHHQSNNVLPLSLWQRRVALGSRAKHSQDCRQGSVSGFTLIESLVAVIILSLTVVSVIPPIFWATATRVQNRRAEQAVQLAQSEIDRVRVAVERRAAGQNQLPPRVGTALRPDAPAPTGVANQLRSVVPGCNNDDGNQSNSVTTMILVDTDPEPAGTACKPEFMVQTFRGRGLENDTATLSPDAFVMGVRVYSYVAEPNLRNGTIQTQAGVLRGGNGLGTQQTRPLAVQYSTIVRSDRSEGIAAYRQLCAALADACFSPNK
jgi:prepilin-type N-terminal cleavage/methylation domain-containing protein